MVVIQGERYNAISDAAGLLGVSTTTVRNYIDKGIILAPPTIKYCLGVLRYFPAEYMATVKMKTEDYRHAELNSERIPRFLRRGVRVNKK